MNNLENDQQDNLALIASTVSTEKRREKGD